MSVTDRGCEEYGSCDWYNYSGYYDRATRYYDDCGASWSYPGTHYDNNLTKGAGCIISPEMCDSAASDNAWIWIVIVCGVVSCLVLILAICCVIRRRKQHHGHHGAFEPPSCDAVYSDVSAMTPDPTTEKMKPLQQHQQPQQYQQVPT